MSKPCCNERVLFHGNLNKQHEAHQMQNSFRFGFELSTLNERALRDSEVLNEGILTSHGEAI